MTKEKMIQREVQHAVKEYVDHLINERSGPGKGMAVSAADLMAASRYAAHRKPAELNVSDFAVTGMKLITATPRGKSPEVRLHASRITTEPIIEAKKKSVQSSKGKTERHWLTWRTTPTPTPNPSTPAPHTPAPATPAPPTPIPTYQEPPQSARPTSARPPSARPPSARPKSARPTSQYKAATTVPVRCQTPRNPTPAPPLSSMSEAALPSHLVPTPEPIHLDAVDYRARSVAETVDVKRAATPAMSARAVTPANLNFQYRDVLQSAPDMQYHNYENYHVKKDPKPAYVPALKQWVNNASDYERDVAYSLFQALGGRAPDAHRKPIKPRPKSALAKTYHSKRRDPAAGVQTTMSAWEAYHNQGLALTGQAAVNMGGTGMSTKHRKIYPPTDYTCESSFFVNSMRPFKPDFTINPEWASEVKTTRYPYKQKTMDPRPNFRY